VADDVEVRDVSAVAAVVEEGDVDEVCCRGSEHAAVINANNAITHHLPWSSKG
jgi:hypothetical protein